VARLDELEGATHAPKRRKKSLAVLLSLSLNLECSSALLAATLHSNVHCFFTACSSPLQPTRGPKWEQIFQQKTQSKINFSPQPAGSHSLWRPGGSHGALPAAPQLSRGEKSICSAQEGPGGPGGGAAGRQLASEPMSRQRAAPTAARANKLPPHTVCGATEHLGRPELAGEPSRKGEEAAEWPRRRRESLAARLCYRLSAADSMWTF